jgi:hypothetical protein
VAFTAFIVILWGFWGGVAAVVSLPLLAAIRIFLKSSGKQGTCGRDFFDKVAVSAGGSISWIAAYIFGIGGVCKVAGDAVSGFKPFDIPADIDHRPTYPTS